MVRMICSAFVAVASVSSLAVADQSDAIGICRSPGICVEPDSKFKNVYPIKPRMQWNIAGGFCGSLSIQTMLLAKGAWVSEDLVRKANIGAACFGHGNDKNGCEVGPENYGETAAGLRLNYDVWNYSQPQPQAAAFKAWIKAHLSVGHPVMWAPMEKGEEPHQPYGPDSCPGGGHFDHHEPMIGMGSQHPLSDPTVYDDDWLLHFSAQDLMPYYRIFAGLEDGTSMTGNCANASTSYPDREAYPCFFDQVAYGLAINGLATDAPTLPVNIDVDLQEEPLIRRFEQPAQLHATVQVHGLVSGQSYALYRYSGINSFPSSDFDGGYEHKTQFEATGTTWEYKDPDMFLSSGATYYIAVPASQSAVV